MSIDITKAEAVFSNENLVVSQPSRRSLEDRIFNGLFESVYETLSESADETTVHQALDELFGALRERKLNSPPEEWQEFIEQCQTHPLMKVLHQDPFTFRAFSKPRGYAGDAVMMDYIYGREEQWPLPEADAI